jgi:hypothetical protein
MIACLTTYKNDVLGLARSREQRKFMTDSFTRWYMNVEKENLFPSVDLVAANRSDLEYANKKLGTRFDIDHILGRSGELHRKYSRKCKSTVNGISSTREDVSKLVTKKQFDRITELYTGDNLAEDRATLIELYKFVGMNTIHLSMPPIYSGIELFGSPLNTHNPYCSPFDIEKKFGSLGSFWDYKFHKSTLYLCNPPYDESIMSKMATKLDKELDDTDKHVIVVITMPVWDSTSQKELGIKDYGMPFEAFDILINSKHFKDRALLDKFKYKYYDYYGDKYVPATFTHLIVMSNMPETRYKKAFSLSEFQSKWLSACS